MLDENPDALSRHYVRKGMAELTNEQLIRLLSDEDVIVRSTAGMLLHLAGGSASDFAAITDLTTHEQAFIREAAAYTLGQFGTPTYPFRSETLPMLDRLLSDPDAEVRTAAIFALMHLGGTEARESILRAATDRSASVRGAVAWVLDLVEPSPDTVAALERLAQDPDPTVREEAEESLAWLRGDVQRD